MAVRIIKQKRKQKENQTCKENKTHQIWIHEREEKNKDKEAK